MNITWDSTVSTTYREAAGLGYLVLKHENNGVTDKISISRQTLGIFLSMLNHFLDNSCAKNIEFFSDGKKKINIDREEAGMLYKLYISIYEDRGNKNDCFQIQVLESNLLDFYVGLKIFYDIAMKKR